MANVDTGGSRQARDDGGDLSAYMKFFAGVFLLGYQDENGAHTVIQVACYRSSAKDPNIIFLRITGAPQVLAMSNTAGAGKADLVFLPRPVNDSDGTALLVSTWLQGNITITCQDKFSLAYDTQAGTFAFYEQWSPSAWPGTLQPYQRMRIQGQDEGSAAIWPISVNFEQTWFTGIDLSGSGFYDCTLSGTTIQNSNFTGSTFNNCDMSGLTIAGCDFTGVMFPGTNLSGTVFTGCTFTNAEIFTRTGPKCNDCRFNGDDFSHGNWDDLSFVNCTFVNVNFTGASLKNTDFTGATFTGCTFAGASLTNTCFDRAHLAGADFSNTDLSAVKVPATAADAPIHSASADPLTRFCNAKVNVKLFPTGDDSYPYDWSYCDLTGTTFVGDDGEPNNALQSINFTGSTLSTFTAPRDWSKINLSFSNLSYTRAEGINLSHAVLFNTNLQYANITNAEMPYVLFFGQSAKLDGATVIGVDFSNAYLAEADFSGIKGADMAGCIFVGACLVGAVFQATDLSQKTGQKDVSFDSACLQGANFVGANLVGVNLYEAVISTTEGTLAIKGLEKWGITSLSFQSTSLVKSNTDPTTTCPSGTSGPCSKATDWQAPGPPKTTWQYGGT